MLSNGGIAKVNLIKENPSDPFEFADWENGTKVLGWYTHTYDDEDGEPSDEPVTMQPPLEVKDNYFYGARKFIAVAPDVLIVADDGGYLDMLLEDSDSADPDDLGKPKEVLECMNMNRIVTVDLSNETITVQDVPVSFDATFAAMESPFFYGIQR